MVVSAISWTPEDSLSCAHCLDLFTNTVDSLTYTFTVTDVNGCQASDNIRVVVDKQTHIYVPNVFSPNGDGENDILPIFGDQSVLKIREFNIFERWGDLVYRAENFLPNVPYFGWDGDFRGNPMNPAVYVYYARVELINGEVVLVKGDITLVR